MSLGLIMRFGRPIDIITALTAGAYDANGNWVPGTTGTITVIGSAQPVTPDDTVQSTPDADRREERIKIFTYAQPHAREGAPLRQADIILIDGKKYEVKSVDNWFMPGVMDIKYYRADAVTLYEEAVPE